MALSLPPTLMEVRAAVATRLNFGEQAARSPAMKNLLDEFIRQAARELQLEANWVELRIRVETDLVDGQASYDFPDNMDPGRIERLIVKSTDGDEYVLQADVQPWERAEYTKGDSPSDLPVRFEFVNEEIILYPAPDTEKYPTLLVEGYSRPPDPQHNDDRIPIDKECLIQWAVVRGKMHFAHKDAQLAFGMSREYVRRLRTHEANPSVIQMGGHFSRKFPYRQRRRQGGGEVDYAGNYWLDPNY